MCKLQKILAIFLAMTLMLSGCSANGNSQGGSSSQSSGSQGASSQQPVSATPFTSLIRSQDEGTVTFVDALGNEKTVKKNPQRVAVGYNSLLELWYLVGGEAVARSTTTENVPEAAQNLPEFGGLSTPNAELLLAEKPDLVILNGKVKAQVDLAPILEQSGIDYLLCDTKSDSYHSVGQVSELFAAILGDSSLYQEKILPIYTTCQAIADKGQAQPEKPTYALLYATTKSVTLESDLSQTCQMLAMLGGENIVKVEELKNKEDQKIDFSMELLAARDPDYLLVCMMGDEDKCREYIAENIQRNSAYASLRAVQEGKVIYLDKQYTIFKPNDKYPEAFAYLAAVLYPNQAW